MTHTKQLLLLLSLTLGVLLAPVALHAQESDSGEDSRIAISDEQHKLNEKAVQAIFDEDYVRAISLLKESLLIGKLNVTYLNLGRAYQKAGRCEEARAAFDKALTAPPVKQPKPRIIELQTRQYMKELEQECDLDDKPAEGATTETTEDTDTTSDEKADAESQASVDKEDGTETAEDDKAGDSDEETEVADKTESAEESEQDAGDSTDMDAPPEVDESGGAGRTVGWAATIAGAALAGGGVGMHFLAESRRNELRRVEDSASDGVVARDEMTEEQFERTEQQANTLDTVGLSMGIAGGVAAGVGVYLLLTSTPSEAPPKTSVWITGDGAGVSWSTRF